MWKNFCSVIMQPTPRASNDSFDVIEPEPHTRSLGLVVLRGPTVTVISPVDGLEEIDNPFAAQE